jgi:uncharacterized membrane protein (UPF0127 family)
MKRLVGMAAVSCLALCGCTTGNASFQWRRVSIAGSAQCLPVASTLEAQQRGLQGVEQVVRPMVFAYSTPAMPSFWMQDTPAPLTGVWVASSGRVIGYWHGQPNSSELHAAPAPISAVIEYPYGATVPALGSVLTIGRRCATRDRRL